MSPIDFNSECRAPLQFKGFYDSETQMCSTHDVSGFGTCRSEYSSPVKNSVAFQESSSNQGVWRRQFWTGQGFAGTSGAISGAIKYEEGMGSYLLGGLANLAVGVLTIGGCGGSSEQRTPDSMSEIPQTSYPDPEKIIEGKQIHWQIDLDGDPEIGEVVHIRQLHFVDNKKTLELLNNEILVIPFYQVLVVKLLQEEGIKHVFAEGLTEDFAPSDQDRLLQKVKEEFYARTSQLPDWEGKDMSVMLAEIVSTLLAGGGPAYALTHPGVWLHKTQTNAEVDQFRQLCPPSSGCPLEIKHDLRESWAVREIQDFLEKNPGQRVALVYGARHRFCDDFERLNFRPRVVSAWIQLPNTWIADEFTESNIPESCSPQREQAR